jgi:hypothetical protein
MSGDDHLHERAERIDDPAVRDDVLVGVMAALSAVPVVGGLISTYISEYVPRQKQRRLVEFVRDLTAAFETERERLDRDYVKTADFDRMVEDVLERVTTVRNEGMHHYWAELLAGVATFDRPDERDSERMIDALDQLREPHLRLLHVIATTNEPPPGLYAGPVSATLKWKMPDVSDADARSDWGDLARFGLVHDYPAGLMTAHGAGDLSSRMTDLGRRFVSLLNIEAETEP